MQLDRKANKLKFYRAKRAILVSLDERQIMLNYFEENSWDAKGFMAILMC